MPLPTTDYIQKFSSVFEADLLMELEAKHMVMEPKAGDVMINPGQTIRAVPIVVNGVFKVSRVNEDGQELLLYYVNERESCAMTFTCCMMAHNSVIKGTAEEDSMLLCVPVTVMDEWMAKYPTWKRFVMTTI